jgi:hypothetical protein
MSGSIRFADRLGAAAGIAFVVLVFLGVASVDPKRGVTDQELLTWWADAGNRDGFVFSMYALLAACPLFLIFVSRVRTRLRATDAAGWSDVFFGCGIVATAALGAEAILRGVIARSVNLGDEPVPGVDTLRFQTELAYFSWDLVMLFMAVAVAVASILALTTQALPRWLGWLGVPIAVASLVLVAAQGASFAIPLLHVWVIASCVHLVLSPATVPAGTPLRQPEVAHLPA